MSEDTWHEVEMSTKNITVYKMAEVRSILYITPDYQIHSERKYPSLWNRFWYRLLLDWRWAKKDD